MIVGDAADVHLVVEPVKLPTVIIALARHVWTAAVTLDDQFLTLQQRERLTDGHHWDLQLPGQRFFARERISDLKLIAIDAIF